MPLLNYIFAVANLINIALVCKVRFNNCCFDGAFNFAIFGWALF